MSDSTPLREEVIQNSEKMDEARRLIDKIIRGLITRAKKPRRNKETNNKLIKKKLRTIYDKLESQKPRDEQKKISQMSPITINGWGMPFGFAYNNTHKYLKVGSLTHPLQKEHVQRIQIVLLEFGIFSQALLIDDDLSSWITFLNAALAAIELQADVDEWNINSNQTANSFSSAAKGPLIVGPKDELSAFGRFRSMSSSPYLLSRQFTFSPQRALIIFDGQSYSARLTANCQLDLSENREAFTSFMLDKICVHPDIETLKQFLKWLNVNRIYFPDFKNDRLWREPEALVSKKFGHDYNVSFVKTRKYLDVRNKVGKKETYESFVELAGRFLLLDDIKGYCEATIKVSHLYTTQNEAEKARTLLLKCRQLFRDTPASRNKFLPLYRPDPFSLFSDISIALTRVEIRLGNLDSALIYAEEALDYAKKANDLHSMGNVYEDVAIILLAKEEIQAARKYNAAAVYCYETMGDMDRALLSKGLFSRSNDDPWPFE